MKRSAADRLSPDLASYYQPLNPAVLGALKTISDAAARHNIPVAVCGEMAGDYRNLEVLLGLGIRTLSVAAPLVPEIKGRAAEFNMEHCREVARQLSSGE